MILISKDEYFETKEIMYQISDFLNDEEMTLLENSCVVREIPQNQLEGIDNCTLNIYYFGLFKRNWGYFFIMKNKFVVKTSQELRFFSFNFQ